MKKLFFLILLFPTVAYASDLLGAHLEVGYKNAVRTENSALQTYHNAQISRCESEKALAQWKLDNGVDSQRTKELNKKATANCSFQ